MWIASVPAAAAPLPGGAPVAATPAGASADAAPFDEALAASLDAGRPVPSGGPPEPGVSRFKLVDWLLSGVAVEATPSGSTQSTASETLVEEELDASDEADEAADELPADVLLMALQVVPQQPAVEVVIVPAEISPAQPAVAQDSDTSAGSRQDTTSALSTAAAPGAPTSHLTAPAQDASASEVRAAEPQTGVRQDGPVKSAAADIMKAEVSASVVRDAAALAPAVASSADARQSAGTEAPALTAGANVDLDAGASATAVPVAGARPVAGVTPNAPSVVMVEEPRTAQPAASAAATAAEAAPVADVVPAGEDLEREPRDAAMAMLRGVASTVPAANTQTPMGGGDARNFENDGRRSPAAQRLAAALSKAGPAVARESGDAAPVPGFSIPAQSAVTATPSQPAAAAPAAAIAVPVQAAAVPSHVAAAVAAPATAPASVDAENVHNLVEAMRITAKAGGWEATVRLKPEHLGEVTIALRVDGKNVSAVVQAESAGVRQWLTSQEEAVRSGLSEHGLQLERFAVSRDGQRREAEQQQPQEQPRRRGQRQAEPGSAPRFEVVV